MGAPINRSIFWFSLAMALALVIYAFARHQLWIADQDCTTVESAHDLEGEAYILDRKIIKCNSAAGSSYN